MKMWDNCDMENVNKHTIFLSLFISHLCVFCHCNMDSIRT